jgi:hypothetical protein
MTDSDIHEPDRMAPDMQFEMFSDRLHQLQSTLQSTTLIWPSGQPSNSAMRVKPAFS